MWEVGREVEDGGGGGEVWLRFEIGVVGLGGAFAWDGWSALSVGVFGICTI